MATTISVAQGSIGVKSNMLNVLTYIITSDAMSTITEKINGVTIGTKTATSGQVLIAGTTQAQWDAIKYGKYSDAVGGLNTLTITMGGTTWTYTFDKRLAADSDVFSTVKAIQDSNNAFLPSVKAKLGSAIRTKGGTVNDTDPFDTMISVLTGMQTKRWASGTGTTAGTTSSFILADGGTYNTHYKLTVTGLSFNPSIVLIYGASTPSTTVLYPAPFYSVSGLARILTHNYSQVNSNTYTVDAWRLGGSVSLVGGFILPVNTANLLCNWIAIE